MLSVMKGQMFIDGNKRVAMLSANIIMIDNRCGIITIVQKNQGTINLLNIMKVEICRI